VPRKQILYQIKHEKRAHPIIGEALPHLSREQKGKPAGMAKKLLGLNFEFGGLGFHVGPSDGD
jgi:hypothetical protein